MQRCVLAWEAAGSESGGNRTRLGVVWRAEDEFCVERHRVPGKRERELVEVVDVYLRLFRDSCQSSFRTLERQDSYREGSCGHDPVTIFGDANATAGARKFKVLQEFQAIREFRVVLEASFLLGGQPVGQRS